MTKLLFNKGSLGCILVLLVFGCSGDDKHIRENLINQLEECKVLHNNGQFEKYINTCWEPGLLIYKDLFVTLFTDAKEFKIDFGGISDIATEDNGTLSSLIFVHREELLPPDYEILYRDTLFFIGVSYNKGEKWHLIPDALSTQENYPNLLNNVIRKNVDI